MSDLAHLCSVASVWADTILQDDYDPTNLAGESAENIRNCHQMLARAFIGLLALHPELKPKFRIRIQSEATP